MTFNIDYFANVLGYVAGALIIITLLPQLITIIRNKSSVNISIPTYILMLIAQAMWIVYAVIKKDWQLVFTNSGTSVIAVFIIGFTIHYRKLEKRNSNYISLSQDNM